MVLPSIIDVRNKMKNKVMIAKRIKMVSIVTVSKEVVVPSGFFYVPNDHGVKKVGHDNSNRSKTK